LVGIETDLEIISAIESGQQQAVNRQKVEDELKVRRKLLADQGFMLVKSFREALDPDQKQKPDSADPDQKQKPDSAAPDRKQKPPIVAAAPAASKDDPDWKDCTSDLKIESLPSIKGDGKGADIEPPYLAMFIANSYAALGQKAAGLEVLNDWIKIL
jgi:hypothetical protein